MLYATCDDLNEDFCDGCFSYESGCAVETESEGSILLAVKNQNVFEVSVIDLDDPTSSCASLDAGPLPDLDTPQSLHGTFVGGRLFVCGYRPEDCFYYDDAAGTWEGDGAPERISTRFIPYGVDLEDGRHWVPGGDLEGGTSEMFDGVSFQESVPIPVETSEHCAVELGNGQVMLVTGAGILH